MLKFNSFKTIYAASYSSMFSLGVGGGEGIGDEQKKDFLKRESKNLEEIAEIKDLEEP